MPFSHDVKDELIRQETRKACCMEAELLAALVLAARISLEGITMATSHPGYAQRLARQLEALSGGQAVIGRDSGHYRVTLASPDACGKLYDILGRHGYDPVTRSLSKDAFLTACCRRAALRGLFLAGGSAGDPERGYHFEIVSRHEAAILLAVRLMRAEGIRAKTMYRAPLHATYLKDGGQISDFLLATGAHGVLLSFESLRVEKDMRNTVNRMVNCDTANSSRVANAAARQLELLRALDEGPGLSALPADLQDAARTRLEFPGLSLKELGERMTPPLGKSGMSHRLRRLERLAEERLAFNGKPS